MPRDRYDDEDDDRPRRRPRRDEDDEDDDDRPRSRRDDEDEDDRPAKKAGGGGKTLLIVFGILGVVLLVCGGGAAVLIYPAYKKVQEAKGRFEATNNMKAVAMGMHNLSGGGRMHAPFHEDPAAGFQPGPPPGDLTAKLSWRVSMLPHLQQNSLYARFDARQPWNGATNQPLANTVVREYADADTPADPTTRIRLFYDNGALFDADRNRRVGIGSVTDGTSNTIAYVESADKVGWTQFNDFRFDPTGTPPPLGKPNASVFLAAMADGSVRAVRKTVSPQMLNYAIGRADGMVVDLDQ